MNNVRGASSDVKDYDRIIPYLVDDTSVSHTFKATHILVPLTLKLRKFFVISGIIYFLFGTVIIALETALIMHSSSTFYRGFAIGCMLVAVGHNLLIAGFSIVYSLAYIIRLLYLLLVTCFCGPCVTVLDLLLISPCGPEEKLPVCQMETAKILKIIILTMCTIALFYTAMMIKIVKRIQLQAASGPLATNAMNYLP